MSTKIERKENSQMSKRRIRNKERKPTKKTHFDLRVHKFALSINVVIK